MIYNHVKSKVITSYVGPGFKEVGSGIRLPVSGMKAMGSGRDQGSQVKYRDQYHFGPIERGPQILNHV